MGAKGVEKVYTDSPQFKYTYTTLILVNSIKEDRQVKLFYEYLSENKQAV